MVCLQLKLKTGDPISPWFILLPCLVLFRNFIIPFVLHIVGQKGVWNSQGLESFLLRLQDREGTEKRFHGRKQAQTMAHSLVIRSSRHPALLFTASTNCLQQAQIVYSKHRLFTTSTNCLQQAQIVYNKHK